jgi:hypothetical protein
MLFALRVWDDRSGSPLAGKGPFWVWDARPSFFSPSSEAALAVVIIAFRFGG